MSEGLPSEDELELKKKTYEKAIRLLARREHATEELKQKLCQKGCDEKWVLLVTEILKKEGYLSDSRYKEMRIRHLIKQGYGESRIQKDLHRFGLSVCREDYCRELSELGLSVEGQIDEQLMKVLKGIDRRNADQFSKFKGRALNRIIARGFSPSLVLQRVKKIEYEFLD